MTQLRDRLLRIPEVTEAECYDSIPSTNTRAKELAAAGAPHGTVVLARTQTAGRGRFDRRFESPQGAGIYLSVIYRGGAEDAPLITTCTAVAVAEAIEEKIPCDVKIKWVNDLWLEEKKICGILTEAIWNPDRTLAYAVIGIGINVRRGNLSPALSEIATSVEEATGVALDIDELTCTLLRRLYARLGQLATRDHLVSYAARSALNGRRVTVARGEEQYDATVRGIGQAGELLLTTDTGEDILLRSGEVVSVHPKE